jgi:hypothetical protein
MAPCVLRGTNPDLTCIRLRNSNAMDWLCQLGAEKWLNGASPNKKHVGVIVRYAICIQKRATMRFEKTRWD